MDSIASAAKILWLRERDPRRMAKAHRHLLLPEYFAWRLTGRAATDPLTASTSGLAPSDGLAHDPQRLCAAEIRADQLAEILWPGTPIGPVTPAAARAWGLSAGTTLVTGDHALRGGFERKIPGRPPSNQGLRRPKIRVDHSGSNR